MFCAYKNDNKHNDNNNNYVFSRAALERHLGGEEEEI